MKTKPFNLEEWKADPTLKVESTSGYEKVRILCTDLNNTHPVGAAVGSSFGEILCYFTSEGRAYDKKVSGDLLMEVRVKKLWRRLYRSSGVHYVVAEARYDYTGVDWLGDWEEFEVPE